MESKILVTGGTGMVGKHLKEILPDAIYISSKDGDLRDPVYVKWLLSSYTPDTVIHLAAKVGGIKDNINKPVDYFNDNILINTNVLKYSFEYKVRKFIGILSTCIYPSKVSKYPMTEKDLFLGPPPQTNFTYAYSKRCLAVAIDAYNKQHNTKYSYLTACNLYSEHDDFNNLDKAHFVTSLLYKIKNCKNNQINLLGTGKPLRQFMYAGDLAQVIKLVIEKNICDSFNVATPENLSIKEMADKAVKILSNNIKVNFKNPQLDGEFRKDVSSDLMLKHLPDFEFTKFNQGIKKVYDKIS